MPRTLPAILFLPPSGESAGERWMSRARLAACRDTIDRLRSTHLERPIVVLAAEAGDRAVLDGDGVQVRAPAPSAEPFHFGRALVAMAASFGEGAVAYFGGASATLASSRLLSEILADACQAGPTPTAWVNNLLSTDWAVLSSS